MRFLLISAFIVINFLIVSTTRLYAGTDDTSSQQVPTEYANKQIPKGWLNNPKVIEDGRAIFQGEKYGKDVSKNKQVNCAKCHGKDGKPIVKRVADLSDKKVIAKMSDSFMFWKISEGIPQKKMVAYKDKLTEDERWSVIAYIRTIPK